MYLLGPAWLLLHQGITCQVVTNLAISTRSFLYSVCFRSVPRIYYSLLSPIEENPIVFSRLKDLLHFAGGKNWRLLSLTLFYLFWQVLKL